MDIFHRWFKPLSPPWCLGVPRVGILTGKHSQAWMRWPNRLTTIIKNKQTLPSVNFCFEQNHPRIFHPIQDSKGALRAPQTFIFRPLCIVVSANYPFYAWRSFSYNRWAFWGSRQLNMWKKNFFSLWSPFLANIPKNWQIEQNGDKTIDKLRGLES
jgi:hypothetical protein